MSSSDGGVAIVPSTGPPTATGLPSPRICKMACSTSSTDLGRWPCPRRDPQGWSTTTDSRSSAIRRSRMTFNPLGGVGARSVPDRRFTEPKRSSIPPANSHAVHATGRVAIRRRRLPKAFPFIASRQMVGLHHSSAQTRLMLLTNPTSSPTSSGGAVSSAGARASRPDKASLISGTQTSAVIAHAIQQDPPRCPSRSSSHWTIPITASSTSCINMEGDDPLLNFVVMLVIQSMLIT